MVHLNHPFFKEDKIFMKYKCSYSHKTKADLFLMHMADDLNFEFYGVQQPPLNQ